jgi:fatty acyl-CoA reductase
MALTETQRNRPDIAEFYSHKDVFITGATGFMGKCLLEKMIRSVPDIGHVMILIRPKRGKTVQERVDSILASKVLLFSLLVQSRRINRQK